MRDPRAVRLAVPERISSMREQMKLVDEIIELASDGKKPLADALRKCLILAFELKNEKLKEWTEKELNGFYKEDVVPKYREANLHSKGNFTGIGGSRMTNRPLPLSVIDKTHWSLLTSRLVQPIAAYEAFITSGKDENPSINWPPDMIVHYQEAFFEDFVLSSAWQEVPLSLMIGLCEEVRNRLLRFALEIRTELGEVGDKASAVAPEKIESAVNHYIYGGVNVFGGTVGKVMQIGEISIRAGDFRGLAEALKKLDVSDTEVENLKKAIDADHKSFGERTKDWLKRAGKLVGKGGVKAGTAAGQEVLKELLLQYFGLK